MLLPRSAEYAIAAMKYLAEQPAHELRGAHEISSQTGIPLPYLWKVLKDLTESQLLHSFRGARGGYQLAKDARRITLNDVVSAVSQDMLFSGCVLKEAECDPTNPCVLHQHWEKFRRKVSKTTISNLKR
jgi:Rrf2 family protein